MQFVEEDEHGVVIEAPDHDDAEEELEDDDEDMDGDDDDDAAKATRPDFVLSGPPMAQPAPAGVVDAGKLDLRTGPMWSVAVAALDPAALRRHVEKLTCAPPARRGVPARRGATFHIGRVVGDRLVMPPWYARLAFVEPDAAKCAPAPAPASGLTRGEPMRPGIAFAGALFAHPPQQQALERYGAWLRDHAECPSCVVSLPCGYGKTVWFLCLARALGRVTLVLTHKLPLVDQWAAEARAFLPGARIGCITDKRARVDGVDFIVASIQSLRNHVARQAPHVASLLARVGCVCLDEGHHAVASTFASVLAVVPARYRVVLTATPRRKDGLLPQLQWVAGPVVFQAFRRVGEVHVLALEYVDAAGAHVERRGRFGVLDTAAMTTALTADANRTAIAVAVIATLAAQQRRRVLVVTPRVEHVHAVAAAVCDALAPHAAALARRVSVFVPAPPPRRRRGAAREDDAAWAAALDAWEDTGPHGAATAFDAPLVGCVVQGMDAPARALAYEGTVVVTTSQMMEEGISYKQWDTLVDLDNTSDPEQVVGRILRACENKRVPLVVDMWTNLSLFAGLFWKRWRMYRAEGFSCRRLRVESVADALGPHWERYNYVAPPVW